MRKHRHFIAALFTLAAPLPLACCAAQSTDPAATAINALGIDLLHAACKPDANALLSPYSIQTGLAMAYAGAEGVTRDEMAKALHYPEDDAALHYSFATFRKELEDFVRQSEESARRRREYGAQSDPITLTMANRLFGQSGFNFHEPFLALVKDEYAAPFEPLDFAENPNVAAAHINEWVETQTQHRIRNLIPDGALNDFTVLVLVNAIYLKTPWNKHFEVSDTRQTPFFTTGSNSFDVPMMTAKQELPYAEYDGFTALNLPFSGHQLQFLILLPRKLDGLTSLEAKLSPGMIAGKLKWEEREVTLFLPRFKLEPPVVSLTKVLQILGMKSAFDIPQGSANFDGMASRHPKGYLYLSDVFHKTFLNLDERGVEAAAASAPAERYGGIHRPPPPVQMRVDHPFIFAIIHQPTGFCLFLGHVTDPR